MQVRLNVDQVTCGMYVAELDIPWLESPFLFQGFIVESEAELATLRKHCRQVVVDGMKSVDDHRVRQLLGTEIRRASGVRSRVSGVEMENVEALRKEINSTVLRQRDQASRTIRAIDDLRLGKSLDGQAARDLVTDVVDTVAKDVNAAWLMSSVRERSSRLADHSLNTSIFATAFAQHLGYNRAACEIVGSGAFLHDIGLSKIPPALYDKPGELTAQERKLIEMHPQAGAQMIAQAQGDIDGTACEIVTMHHERVNGRGYPNRARGVDVPEYAQIVALADMYETMISETPYARGKSPQQALAAIHAHIDIAFDKTLVEEFIKCIGIFPVGSLVQLQNGSLGIIVSSSSERRLAPILLMVRDPLGKEILPRRTVDLSRVSPATRRIGWQLSKIVDGSTIGINVPSIVRASLAA